MANRFFNQFGGTLERKVIKLFAKILYTGGAPQLGDQGNGTQIPGGAVTSNGDSGEVLDEIHPAERLASPRVAEMHLGKGSLDGEERVEELARMLAGVEVTETARSHAREMLERRTPAPAAKATRRRR